MPQDSYKAGSLSPSQLLDELYPLLAAEPNAFITLAPLEALLERARWRSIAPASRGSRLLRMCHMACRPPLFLHLNALLRLRRFHKNIQDCQGVFLTSSSHELPTLSFNKCRDWIQWCVETPLTTRDCCRPVYQIMGSRACSAGAASVADSFLLEKPVPSAASLGSSRCSRGAAEDRSHLSVLWEE